MYIYIICLCKSCFPSVDILMIGFVSGRNPRAELCLFMLTSRRLSGHTSLYIYLCIYTEIYTGLNVLCSYPVNAMDKFVLLRHLSEFWTTSCVVLSNGNSRVESLRRTGHL